MPNLTTWCETIVWQKYPECNAKLIMGKKYLVKFRDGYCQEDYWDGKEKINRWRVTPDSSVVYFADLPTGSIGDEFGIETAKLLMLNNYACVSCVDKHIYVAHTVDDNTYMSVAIDGSGVIPTYETRRAGGELLVSSIYELPIKVILGKWRLA